MDGQYQSKMMSLQRLFLNISTLSKQVSICFAITGMLIANGCNGSRTSQSGTKSNNPSGNVADQHTVKAQGRIQPERGLIRISALPGDRVEQIHVRAGDHVLRNQELANLQSQSLRALERQAAMLRLEEAKALRDAKQQEAELNVDAAKLKLEAAKESLQQALEQQAIAKKSFDQLTSIQQQITTLQQLRDAPLTRAAIGTIELEVKKSELQKATTMSEQAILAADQAVHLAQLQVSQGDKMVVSAEKSRSLVDAATPIASLEKQIELLNLQLEQSKILAPLDCVIISVNAEVGERTGPLPLVELADLTTMVCVAEVHESDAARVAVGDVAKLTSSALRTTLTGKVSRIDRVVGAAQMRSPNPMARSDFRSIPVWIVIDKDHTAAATERLQLQVDVSINVTLKGSNTPTR
jgi:HlyD family secretion protein